MKRGGASQKAEIGAYYAALLRAWGPQHWWPAQSRLEVVAGGFLTQNTAWRNVERALASLRSARKLSLRGIRGMPAGQLAQLIRSSGYFRQKAARLKNFVRFLDRRYGGSLARMFARPTEELRKELLALNGVGPETADSILLYAGGHPVFVVDAYTRRIFERHGIVPASAKYDEIRALVEGALAGFRLEGEPGSAPGHPPSRMSRARRSELAQHYNELHGLIVRAGKDFCGTTPRCDGCPLQPFLPTPQAAAQGSGKRAI